MLKKIGYGLILWVIPYVTAIPLLPLMRSDLVFFKTIMVVESSIVGAVLAASYFQSVERNFLREGIVLAAVWIVMNWLLDFVGLLPFSDLSLGRYFIEIGLRYLAIAALAVAIGYVLQKKRSEGSR
jgi:uncharacterized membrane protein YpjA